jgi:hypothetical protein
MAQDLNWEKLNFMISKMGLLPWYLRLDGSSAPQAARRR